MSPRQGIESLASAIEQLSLVEAAASRQIDRAQSEWEVVVAPPEAAPASSSAGSADLFLFALITGLSSAAAWVLPISIPLPGLVELGVPGIGQPLFCQGEWPLPAPLRFCPCSFSLRGAQSSWTFGSYPSRDICSLQAHYWALPRQQCHSLPGGTIAQQPGSHCPRLGHNGAGFGAHFGGGFDVLSWPILPDSSGQVTRTLAITVLLVFS